MTEPVYSRSRVATGPTLYVSGQVPLDRDGAVPEDASGQTRVVLDRIAEILAEHGVGWAEVVRVTYYLTDLADLPAVREVVRATFPQPRPSASLVEVKALVDPRFRVEIDAVADLGSKPTGQ